MATDEWEWRSGTGLSFTMKRLVAILAVLVGIFLLANIRHVDTLPETQRVELVATDGQILDATLRGEPPPPFEDSTKRLRSANARFRDTMLELAIARATDAKRKCELEAERLGKSSVLWCAGISYGR
jgi:hypothetical protein